MSPQQRITRGRPQQQQLTLQQFEESFGTRQGRAQFGALISTEEGRRQVAEFAQDPRMVDACERVFSQRGGVRHFAKLMGSRDGIETMKLIYENPQSADTAFRLFKTDGGSAAVKRILFTHPRRGIRMLYYQATSSAGTNPPGAPLESTHLGANKKGVVCDAHDQQINAKLAYHDQRVGLETAAEFFRRPEKTARLSQYLEGQPERVAQLEAVWGADKKASLQMLSRICNSDTGFQNLEQFMREHPREAKAIFGKAVGAEKTKSAYDLRRHLFETIPPTQPPQTDHLQGGRISNATLDGLFSQRNEASFQAFAECFSSDAKLSKLKNYLRSTKYNGVKTLVGLLTQSEGCVEKTVASFDSALAAEGGARRLAEMIADPYGTRVIASVKATETGSLEISSLFGKPGGREAIKELIGGDSTRLGEKIALVARAITSSLFPAKPEVRGP